MIQANENEIWKDIPGYPNYQVSSIGRFRVGDRYVRHGAHRRPEFKKQTLLKIGVDPYGYPYCSIRSELTNNKCKRIFVHRLVAMAFVPNPENLPFVNHINGIKADNRPENLEWCTSKQNLAHARRVGLLIPPVGERSSGAKLKSGDIIKIRKMRQLGTTLKSIGHTFGVHENTIASVVNCRTWKHIQ